MSTTDDADDEPPEELLASDGLATRQEYQMRFALAQTLGENLPGDDDYYEVFNWNKDPSVEDFYALALRNPYAYAVTFLPPKTGWRESPTIRDTAETENDTDFETDLEDIVDEHKLWHYCLRADKLAGIGKFGVLVIQFDDIKGADGLQKPVGNPDGINGFRPFSEASVDDVMVGGPSSDRWGEPIRYKLDLSDENEEESGVMSRQGPDEIWVHWTRVIHISSDELLDDEIRGVERQRPVYNNLIDIEKALGSAGELAYRASAWGINVNIDKDFQLDDDGDELSEHLQRWQHGLENVLKTHGADEVKSLGGEEIDPSLITDPNIEAISAQTGIPQSILKGNETGERATTQDLKEWYGKVGERQTGFQEPMIARPIIDRLRTYDIITDPQGGGYLAEWPPLAEMDESDRADIRKTRAEALKTWPFAEDLLTPEQQRAFVKTGELPTELEDVELPALDESSDAVAQFEVLSTPSDD